MAITTIQAIIFIVVITIIIAMIYLSKKGKITATVQRIPALDSIDEVIERATETGRPIFFSVGGYAKLRGDLGIQTMAGIDTMAYLARRCASVGTKLLVGVSTAESYPLHRDAYQTAYIAEGKAEQFDPTAVLFWGDGLGKYNAGVQEVITSQKPAAFVNIGPASSDILSVAHVLSKFDMITIGGTARLWGLETQIMCCDYVIINEEIFAVAAYLNKQPTEAASLLGQDVSKFFIIAIILINLIGLTIGRSLI